MSTLSHVMLMNFMLCRVMSLPVSQFSWQWVSDVTLSDIDECTTGVHNCNESATCTNTEGGFTCQCLPDYTGNGTHCRGVTSALWLALSLISHHTLKPGFHSNAIACVVSRNKRKRQPIGMLSRSSGNHDWLLANASACVFLRFSFTQRTQRKRLRLNGNRA